MNEAQAQAGAFTASYGISLAGVPIGVARLTAKLEGAAYSLDMHAKFTGLAGVLTSGKGGAKAAGSVNGQRPYPASLAVVSSSSDTTRTLRLAFGGSQVSAVEIKPPLENWDKPDRVPVRDSDKRDVVDPLSALLMPVAAGATPRSACDRTIPVFDGATRFDIVLSYARTETITKDSYSGPAVVCLARYVPISGHRPNRSVTVYMRDNRDMSVWLVPVADTNIYMPYRISVKTMLGTSVLEASKLSIEPTQTAAAGKGRSRD